VAWQPATHLKTVGVPVFTTAQWPNIESALTAAVANASADGRLTVVDPAHADAILEGDHRLPGDRARLRLNANPQQYRPSSP
jgi:hypothetical protein